MQPRDFIGQPDIPLPTRKAMGCAVVFGALVLLVVFFLTSAKPYAEYLWYQFDAHQPQVFTKEYGTKGLLFLPAFLIAWAILYFNLREALKLSMVYLQTPSNAPQVLISNVVRGVKEFGGTLVKFLAPVFAFVTAMNFSGNWNTYLLGTHAQTFGKTDPLFGKDLGFFVFTLPWYRAVVGATFGLLFTTTLLTIAIYVGLQLLAALAKIELGRPQVRTHISLVLGATLLVLGLNTYLTRFDYGLHEGLQFAGAGYAASQKLAVQGVLAWVLIITGAATMVSFRFGKPYQVPAWGIAFSAMVFVLGMVAWPGFVQKFQVEPDKLNKEAPFAAKAIQMTRFAYNLDVVEPRDFPIKPAPTDAELHSSQATLDNMRLWDPAVVQQSIEVLQGLKPYYSFNDVDIDRYTIGGKKTMVMLSPRDIRLDGLTESAKTWVNTRLQYTHGFGITMAPVNSASSNGEPAFAIRDIPPTTPADLPLTEPRLYFSDFRDTGGRFRQESYALVDSKVAEFDYPAQDKAMSNRWTGTGGIPVGGLFRRLILATALGDGNLLVSGNVTESTRLLVHRGVLDRAGKMYPFLQFDDDPYIVLLNGKLIWLLDGYTTTDRMPYSETMPLEAGAINYIRNPVKVTVDAYTGETNAYAIEANEPILKAYRSIYPGLVKDAGELPEGIREHFRYPEDMFTVQARMLTSFHVTDPTTFLNNNDAWEMPVQRGTNGQRMLMVPYYVLMKLPDESANEFVLMLPFTPRGKANMSGWLAAHCDPDRYGRMTLYNFAKGANVAGPEQMETNFTSDPKVTSVNLQLKGGGETEIVVGNLLVIPIGSSVMYVETLFPRGSTQGMQAAPRLKKVILALNERIVIADTYDEALKQLFTAFAADQPTVTPPGTEPTKGPTPPPVTPNQKTVAKEALELYKQSDAALKAGDWAKYGEVQKQIRAKLEQLARG